VVVGRDRDDDEVVWWYLFSGPAGARGGNANLSGPAEEDWLWQMGHARTAGGRTAAEPQAKLVVEVDNNSILKKLQHKNGLDLQNFTK
jgi:hypothetical protein